MLILGWRDFKYINILIKQNYRNLQVSSLQYAILIGKTEILSLDDISL
jgi:hypothetical protein